MGIEPERVRLEWISAAEGDTVQEVINEMAEQLGQLGPLRASRRSPRRWTASTPRRSRSASS